MVKVNPQLLVPQPRADRKREASSLRPLPPQRGGSLSVIALAKKAISDVLSSTVLRVKVDDERGLEQIVGRIIGKLEVLNSSIKNMSRIEMGETPASIQIQTMSEKTIEKLIVQLVGIKAAVIANKQKLPDVQDVRVTNPEPKQEFPIQAILTALSRVEDAVSNIRIDIPEPQQIKFPEMPKIISLAESKELIKIMKEVSTKLDDLPKNFPDVSFPTSISVDNFPPQKYPMPVTHISINSLAGTTKSRNITVGTSPTPLPDEVLAYRRSLVIYNNSSQTLYVGGSDVSTTNGMPVPATSYSPAFDAGPKMIIYGIVAATTANVRTLEVSDINSGS